MPPTFTLSARHARARRARSRVPSTVSIPIVYEVGGASGERPSSRQTGTPSRLPTQSWSAASRAALAAASPPTAASRAPIASSANGSSPSSGGAAAARNSAAESIVSPR